jgi:hypothetical protein
MATEFKKLSLDWNADPNCPLPQVTAWEHDIVLSFFMNHFRYKQFSEGDIGQIRFRNCWRYHLAGTNDEGWNLGQCRFSKLAPEWGEFYEISGNLLLDKSPNKWVDVGPKEVSQKHFLFYFRDKTFECAADSWSFSILK